MVCDGEVGMGAAGLEAEIGNVGALFKAKSERPKRVKKGNVPFKGGGQKNGPEGRGAKAPAPPESSTAAAATSGEAGGGADVNKAPTRERSQQLYEIYRQTQVCEGHQRPKDRSPTQAEACVHPSSLDGCVSTPGPCLLANLRF